MKKFILALLIITATLIPAYASSKVEQLSHAIAKAEGFYTRGTVPNRFNNPGDITSSSLHAYPGQIGLSPHRHYVIFKNASHGWAALQGQIQKIIDGTSKKYTQNMTFTQMSLIYSSGKRWGTNVCAVLHISPQTTFEEFFELPPRPHYELDQSILRALFQS